MAFGDLVVYVRRPLVARLVLSEHFIQGSCRELINFPRLYPAVLAKEDVAYLSQEQACLGWVD